MGSYTELVGDTADAVSRYTETGTAAAGRAVNDAIREVALRTRCLRRSSSLVLPESTSGDYLWNEDLGIEDFLAVVTWGETTAYTFLELDETALLRRRSAVLDGQIHATGLVAWCCSGLDTLMLVPTFPEATALGLVYARRPEELVADDDVSPFGPEWDDLVVNLAAARATHVKSPAGYKLFKDAAEDQLRDFRRFLNHRGGQRPTVVPTPSYGV